MRTGTTNQIDLYLIRHGMTKANEAHRYLGWTDESLSERGINELMTYRDQGFYGDIPQDARILVSPMKRCLESAEILFPDAEKKIVEGWQEMNFGQFEYMNYQELTGNPDYQAWIDSFGRMAFPGGESREVFVHRVCSSFQKWICDIRDAEYIAAVVHGGTIMAIMSQLTQGEYFDYQVKPGQGFDCRIEIEGDAIRLLNWRKRV